MPVPGLYELKCCLVVQLDEYFVLWLYTVVLNSVTLSLGL